jgi:hypothetical protein
VCVSVCVSVYAYYEDSGCVCVCVYVYKTSRRDGGKLMVELCGLDWKCSMMPCCIATCTSFLCQKRPKVEYAKRKLRKRLTSIYLYL